MNIREWLASKLGFVNKLDFANKPPSTKKPAQQESKQKECIKMEHLTLQKAGDVATWETWDALWKKMMLTVPEYSQPWKEYKYNKDVIPFLSKYFDKPKDVPARFNNIPAINIEKHIILWAVEEDVESVLQRCGEEGKGGVSYPVLDIVKSVLRCPDDWDVAYESIEAPSKTIGWATTITCCTYKGCVLLGNKNIYGTSFTELERELISWCEERVNKVVTERTMNKRREEFNNKWKELNCG